MSDITLSKAVRSNLLSLQNTANLMSATQTKLATGKKVNSALDNPTNFFTASSLNARAGDMNALLDGMANGIQTLEAADNGLKAITKTLESMQSTLRQARQDKSFETKSFDLKALSESTTLTGTEQLSFVGGAGLNATIDLTKSGSVTDPATAASTAVGTAVTLPDAATGASQTSSIDLAGLVTALGGESDGQEQITVNDGSGGSDITINIGTGANAASDVDGLISEINGQLTSANIEAFDDGGNLAFRTKTGGEGETTGFGITGAGSANIDSDDFSTAVQGEAEGSISFSVQGPGDSSATPVSLTRSQIESATGSTDAAKLASAINAALGSSRSVSAEVGTGADAGSIRLVATTAGAGTIAVTNDTSNLFGTATAGQDAQVNANGNVAKTVDELVTEINRAKNDDGSDNVLAGKIRASNDNGKLRIENLATSDLSVGGATTGNVVDGTTAAGTGSAEIGGNDVRADLAKQFNELRDQLDKLADDASFNGINLLRGDNLQITFNETGTSEINIRTENGKTINSDTLGVETTLTASDLDSDDDIDGFLNNIKGALNEVRSQSSAFGSNLSVVQNRQDFTKNMINTLQTGASNLTLADTNEEAANLLALQTRQQLSSTALSMASQADQAVLRLF